MTTYSGTVSDVRATLASAAVSVTARTAHEIHETVWSALDPAVRIAGFAITPVAAEAPPLLIS